MPVTINRKQIKALARAVAPQGATYLQTVDLIAVALGYQNQAALMAKLNEQADVTDAPKLEDWRAPEDIDEHQAPRSLPIDVNVEVAPQHVDVMLGGAQADPYGPQASSLRVEREGNVTRVMIYDSLCDAPRVFGVPDGKPIEELPNDWQPEQVAPDGDLEL